MSTVFRSAPNSRLRARLDARATRASRAALPLAVLALATLSTLATLSALGPRSAQAVATPFSQTNVGLANLASEITYSVDMSTLPLRPKMIVEAVPDSNHADMELRLEITNCNLDYPSEFYTCLDTFTPSHLPRISTPGTGPRSIDFEPFDCGAIDISPTPYAGKTCSVKVRALSFGAAGPPATFDVTIRGETVAPTSTITPQVTTTTQSVSIAPFKDTTVYQANTSSSNGIGDSIWVSLGTGSNRMQGLLGFNVASNVPANATIVDARLDLNIISTTGSPPALDLFAISNNPAVPWLEGTANAAGDESTPPTAVINSASWSHRRWNSVGAAGPWATAGGDRILPALLSTSVPATGTLSLSSSALLDVVRAFHVNSSLYDGLLLVPTSGSARFASDENATVALRPRLVVQYFQQSIINDNGGVLELGTVDYFTETQNFRWIYDTNNDNVLVTPIAGRCEAIPPANNFSINYSYQYQGSPTYQGLDCCSWQLGSPTGVTGAGQAIFYVNFDSSNPANQPGDGDADGIKDLCDNCPGVPNGPLLGSCTTGPKIQKLCKSNQQCGGGICSLGQDDADRVLPGDACVPEPGIASMLAAGLGALAWRARRRVGANQDPR